MISNVSEGCIPSIFKVEDSLKIGALRWSPHTTVHITFQHTTVHLFLMRVTTYVQIFIRLIFCACLQWISWTIQRITEHFNLSVDTTWKCTGRNKYRILIVRCSRLQFNVAINSALIHHETGNCSVCQNVGTPSAIDATYPWKWNLWLKHKMIITYCH
jgi:hypothetical protein